MHESIIKMTEDGEEYVEIPEACLEELGWNEHTVLDAQVIGGTIHICHKTVWTVDELQQGDNIEKVIEDVKNNKATHLIKHKDDLFMINPVG